MKELFYKILKDEMELIDMEVAKLTNTKCFIARQQIIRFSKDRQSMMQPYCFIDY